MTDFPTLARYPDGRGFKETLAYDPSLKSNFENGTVLSRSRFTVTKKKWTFIYHFLTEADKVLLTVLQDTVMVGADVFDWTNPQDNTSYSVRLHKPIDFTLETGDTDKWQANLILVEA